MRTGLKFLFWFTTLTGVLLTGLVLLLWSLDADYYRQQLERRLSQAVDRQVLLQGPIVLEPSLAPRLTVNGLQIGNPEWASRPHLATIGRMDIRIRLLPLLKGELEVVFVELHNVDLLLEEHQDGSNNFPLGDSTEPQLIPTIKRLFLNDVDIGYAGPGQSARSLHLEQASGRLLPDRQLDIEAFASVNEVPFQLSLHAESQKPTTPTGPWQVQLDIDGPGLSLRLQTASANPKDFGQGDYRVDLEIQRLSDLNALLGHTLSERGPYHLSADFGFKINDYLQISNLQARAPNSDIQGNLHWDMGADRPALRLRFTAPALHSKDLGVDLWDTDCPGADCLAFLDQSLPLDLFSAIDLDLGIHVQRLEGLTQPVRDLSLSAEADGQQFQVKNFEAMVDSLSVTTGARLPWPTQAGKKTQLSATLGQLLQQLQLDFRVQAAQQPYRQAFDMSGDPLELTISSLEVKIDPLNAVWIKAEAAVNDMPIAANLSGEPLAVLLQNPSGPLHNLVFTLLGEGIRLDASGSLAKPLEGTGYDISYQLHVTDPGRFIPLRESVALRGHYSDHQGQHVFDQLQLTVGDSAITGRIQLFPDLPRPRLAAELDAESILLDQLLAADADTALDWAQPLDLSALGAVDLDLRLGIRLLDGLAKPITDLRLGISSDAQTLTLAPVQASLEQVPVNARLELPWGRHLPNPISLRQLAASADLSIDTKPAAQVLSYRWSAAGNPIDLELTELEARAQPGRPLTVSAGGLINQSPLQLTLQGEPLAEMLRRPEGPWRELVLEAEKNDSRLRVTGGVEQPLAAKGFDLEYALEGDDIEQLLPLLGMLLPLEGAYSLSGRFSDQPDHLLLHDLHMQSGGSDIGGMVRIYRGNKRPRVEADLHSEQILLEKLLAGAEPETAPETAVGGRRKLIPDYQLPIESLQGVDGELRFKGKKLRTPAGDLGDINFEARLEDDVLRVSPFQVQGWGSALIESELEIDASREPPALKAHLTARQLDYGLLLNQAGYAETVEGKLDITLDISGSGHSRYQLLEQLDGDLVIVGKEGRFGSRRLDLWGSDLIRTMFSRRWRQEDVTELNCVVAHIGIAQGIASSDKLLIDTRRITIGAAGTLDLNNEQIDLVFAPRPKRASLLSLTNPVRIRGSLAAPEVSVTVLPRNRTELMGTGLLAGLVNPGLLLFTFSRTGTGEANPCEAAVANAMVLKAGAE